MSESGIFVATKILDRVYEKAPVGRDPLWICFTVEKTPMSEMRRTLDYLREYVEKRNIYVHH